MISDVFIWILGLLLGAASGYIHIRYPDLSLLMVMAFTMLLGALRPRRPWRWVLLVASCLPLAELIAYFTREHFNRGLIYGAFMGFLPAIAGAFGGSFMRQMVNNLFAKN